KHLKTIHECNCPGYTCTKPRHLPRDLIDRLILISLDTKYTATNRWVRMYKAAFPTRRRVPGPCVPRVNQTLSLAKNPGSVFKATMINRLARAECLSVEEAAKELRRFLNRLPLFYDVITWPEVWRRDSAPPSVNDESGDEQEESDMRSVGVAEPLAYEATDYSIQEDDGPADEVPDTQTEQETDPSAPSST
ncbi:hypothetical protein N0V84_011788, partial [Fusarium piperis]